MVTPSKRPGPDDTADEERPASKKAKGNPAPKRDKGKSKAKANDDIKPANKKGQGLIDRREWVKNAYKMNPEHVMVISPKGNNWHDLPTWVAGYLGVKGDLEPFRKFLLGEGEPVQPSKLIHAILNRYNEIRSEAYGRPISTTMVKALIPNISVKKIWTALVNSSYDILFTEAVKLPLHLDWGFTEGTQPYVVAVHVATMSYLIHQNPRIFTTSHQALSLRPNCVGKTNIPAEDWYRAFVLLCFYRRQTSAAKCETGFLAKQKKAEAKEVEYFTAEEVAELDLQELNEALDDVEGRTSKDVIQELFSTVASDEIPATQVIEDMALPF